ncbi:MAG TPA: hypothetical protein VFH73_13205 [Polyangia bacterium]|jgi:hypothetical protein|nr:hypothetical protein [Polyangia bacterium]
MPSKTLIAIKNLSTVVTDAAVAKALPAFQQQVSTDFCGTWGIDATLKLVGKKSRTPPGAWLLGIFDDADQAGALGYHDLTSGGLPLGKVFAKTTLDNGGLWTVTFSHELLEILADPNINLCAFDEGNRRLYAYEVCDAVEADKLGYVINGVTVSDFVLPGWFEPTHITKNERFAFKSRVTAPFQLLAGGYIGYFDLGGGGWQQLTAREASDARQMTARSSPPAAYEARPRVGSRRERRRLVKTQWLVSTAD